MTATDTDNILNITKVELYKGDTLVRTADEVTAREFTELLSNNEYKVQVTYTYDLNDGDGWHTETASAEKTTVEKTVPTVMIVDFVSKKIGLSFGIEIEDVDNILTIADVQLYDGDESKWNQISIDPNGKGILTSATRYYYSKKAPTMPGNYWHYDASGKIVVWEN